MKLHLTAASENDLWRIHEASLKILHETGCIFDSEKALGTLKKHGVTVRVKLLFSIKISFKSL